MNLISEIIDDIRNGKMVILVDDEDRENEGDIILAADFISPDIINFMATEARGLICLSLTAEQCEKLKLPLMVGQDENRSPNQTAFTVSIEASTGVSTGISAADRSHTIRVASNPLAKPNHIIMPGHIFPIRAQDGGVLKRAGHTEASLDLARLAGLNPAAVICEVMKSDGSMARVDDLKEFAAKHKIKIGTIEDLIAYRLDNEILVEEVAKCVLPTVFSKDFTVRIFRNRLDQTEHIVLQKGRIKSDQPVLVRVHVESLLGDVMGSLRDFSGHRLQKAMARIAEEECGVLLYIRQNQPSALSTEVERWAKEDDITHNQANSSRPMDSKDYGIGAQILKEIGIKKMRLLTNNSSKKVGLKAYGIDILEEVPLFEDGEHDAVDSPFQFDKMN